MSWATMARPTASRSGPVPHAQCPVLPQVDDDGDVADRGVALPQLVEGLVMDRQAVAVRVRLDLGAWQVRPQPQAQLEELRVLGAP